MQARHMILLLLVAVASWIGCGKKEEPSENTKDTAASVEPLPEKPAPMVFSVEPVAADEKVAITSLTGRAWTGTTTWNKQWVRVSFDVYPFHGTVANIKVEGGLEGGDKVVWTWDPENATSAIQLDGTFEFTDSHGNFIRGKFGAANYASGTISKLAFEIECADGKFRPAPTQWRAAPE